MEPAPRQQPLDKGVQVGDYRVVEAIGYGGFSVTYLALDTVLKRTVVLKEYAPRHGARREANARLSPARDTDGDLFSAGLDAFLLEARTLAAFRHRNIVQIHRILEANGTAYIVMAHEGGESLEALLARGEHRDEAALTELTLKLLDALECVHRAGVLHRDIKPTNILINSDGEPRLFDFGAARQPLRRGEAETRASLTAGYAPYEQYIGSGIEQGPWTDIYAFGATLHRAVLGKPPPDARTRGHAHKTGRPDPYLPLVDAAPAGSYSRAFLAAIDWALVFDAASRPRSCTQWQRRLTGDAASLARSVTPHTGQITEVWDGTGITGSSGSTVSAQTPPVTEAWSAEVPPAPVQAPLRSAQAPPTVPAPALRAVPHSPAAGVRTGGARTGGAWAVRLALLAAAVAVWWLPGALDPPPPPPVLVQRQPLAAPEVSAPEPEPDARAEPDPASPSPAQQAAAERRARIEALLLEAETLSIAGSFSGPEPPHALSRYREVLDIDPGNTAAVRGISRIVTHYAEAARTALDADPQAALALAERGLEIEADHAALVELADRATAALERARTLAARRALEAERRATLDALAASAERQYAAGYLTSPPGDNALATLERLLALAPGEERALRLRARIAGQYAAGGRAALAAGNPQESSRLAGLGLRVEPGHPELLALRADIEQYLHRASGERERQQRDTAVASLLLAAAEQVRQARYTAPDGANAWRSYREALALAPGNREAQQGLQRLAEQLYRLAEQARDRGDVLAALAWRDQGARVEPAPRWQQFETSLAGLSLRDTLRSGGAGPVLVFVPAGRFTMGDVRGTGFAGEQPSREAQVPAALFAGRYEVTFDEFDRFTDAHRRARVADELWGRGRLPVVNVSWQDANAYTEWLSAQTGHRYRLPTETEWEYVARAGTRTDYWWGEAVGDGQANCKQCGAAPVGWRTLPVGSFKANPFGLYDTAGNVYEWTASPYTVAGAGGGPPRRVSRGGSWFDGPRFSRVSMRLGAAVDFRVHFQGLRVVRDIDRALLAARGEDGA